MIAEEAAARPRGRRRHHSIIGRLFNLLRHAPGCSSIILLAQPVARSGPPHCCSHSDWVWSKSKPEASADAAEGHWCVRSHGVSSSRSATPLLVLDAGLRVRAAAPTFHAVFDILNGEAGGRSAFVRLTAGHARPRDGGERHPHEHQGVDRMWDFWSRLFDPSGFPARWRCGAWTPGHGWLHILSDVGIWAAYFVMPYVLGYYACGGGGYPSGASSCCSWRSSWRAG